MSAAPFDVPFACIIGAPRSGTTWLQAMVGAHPRVCTAQELKVFDLFTAPWEHSWQRLIDLQQSAGGGPRGLRIVWSDEEFYRVLSDLLKDIYGRVLQSKPGADVVLDKSPGYSRHIAHIQRLIPHVKFIHVVRDGRDVAASLRVASRGWARAWAPSAIDSAATLWKSMVLDARAARRLGPDHYLELRYEQLRSDGPASLLEVFAFVGVPATAEDAGAIYEQHTIERMRDSAGHPFALPRDFFRNGRAGGWRDELSARERYAFDAAAGDLLRELGYADSSWWRQYRYQRWLLPAFAGVPVRRRLQRLLRRLSTSGPEAGT
ncbi:MAG TPA: sulfotransferase [Longimicrobiales bacterium]|nr:sulfotransferase [Longimicrobiales bacterium]